MDKSLHFETDISSLGQLEEQKINKFVPQGKTSIFVDDISELIYLNGSLEFRENKKL